MGSRIQSAVFVSHSPSPTFVDSRPAPNTARSTHPAVPATTARPTDATPTTLPILHKSFRISGHERCSDGVSPPAAATLHIGHAHVCEPPRVPQQIFRRCLRPGTPSPHHCSHCRPEKRERQRRSAGPEGAAAKMLCSLLEELLRLHLPTPPMTRQLQQLRKAQLGRPVPPTNTAPSLATSRSPKAWIPPPWRRCRRRCGRRVSPSICACSGCGSAPATISPAATTVRSWSSTLSFWRRCLPISRVRCWRSRSLSGSKSAGRTQTTQLTQYRSCSRYTAAAQTDGQIFAVYSALFEIINWPVFLWKFCNLVLQHFWPLFLQILADLEDYQFAALPP